MAVFQSIREFFVPAVSRPPEIILPAPATTYTIHTLTERSLRELLRLNSRCFRNGENYTKHTFSYLLNEPRSLAYKAVTAGGEMSGYIFALGGTDGIVHITTVGVAPEHRRRGVAEMLLVHLEERLTKKGHSTVVLEVRVSNLAAQSLYRKAGYSCVQRLERYYSDGEDGFLMTKSLY